MQDSKENTTDRKMTAMYLFPELGRQAQRLSGFAHGDLCGTCPQPMRMVDPSGNPRGRQLPPETIWKSGVVATYTYCYSTLYCVCCSGDHSTLPWGKWIREHRGRKEDSTREKGLTSTLHLRCRKVSGKRSAEQNHKRFKRQNKTLILHY